MVCFSICGLASEAALLDHKREVATATSRFMNAAPVDVIDRLKSVLLFEFGQDGFGSGCLAEFLEGLGLDLTRSFVTPSAEPTSFNVCGSCS